MGRSRCRKGATRLESVPARHSATPCEEAGMSAGMGGTVRCPRPASPWMVLAAAGAIAGAPPAAGQYDPGRRAEEPKPAAEGPTMEIYGFVMTDVGYQFNQSNPNYFDVLRTTQLPSFEDEFGRDGRTFFGVRQSRLGFKAEIPTGGSPIKTTFEFNLFGSGPNTGQTIFRLRHAYAEYGNFGAGQTWSPFMDTDAFPNSVEY